MGVMGVTQVPTLDLGQGEQSPDIPVASLEERKRRSLRRGGKAAGMSREKEAALPFSSLTKAVTKSLELL